MRGLWSWRSIWDLLFGIFFGGGDIFMRGCDFFGELLWDVILGLFAVIGRVHLYEKFVIYEKIKMRSSFGLFSFVWGGTRESVFHQTHNV